MLKNIFRKKQTIEAQTIVDLRHYTPQALNNIKAIEAVALLVLPENPDNNFINAFSKIKLDAVGFTLNLPKDKKIAVYNGVNYLSNICLTDDTLGVFNGIFIMTHEIENESAQYIINGIMLKKAGLLNNGKCLIENGLIFEMEFEESDLKFFSNNIDIDLSFIRNLQDNALIASGGTITLERDITEEIIIEKNIRFFSANMIKCDKKIKGCVQARACIANKIVC